MPEFEFGGMTFRGGKMVAVLTALSTAGGAFLEYLEGKDLPGLTVLK